MPEEPQIVVDTSAWLAVYFKERGHEQVAELLSNSAMSSVNAAEALTVLVRTGSDPDRAWAAIAHSVQEIVALDREQARICGGLITLTSALGLSAGPVLR